jgi:hypothetical protein
MRAKVLVRPWWCRWCAEKHGGHGDESGHPPAPSTVLHEERGSGHDE